jgi:hypothetical protein
MHISVIVFVGIPKISSPINAIFAAARPQMTAPLYKIYGGFIKFISF